MNYEEASANIVYSEWFYDCPAEEFETYSEFGAKTLQAPPLVKCIFLDLIDHSESND